MPARILIVEDNAASLELVSYILSNAGHSILTAMDGADGLRVALECHPDLVLCDLQLPELDGFGVIRLLRKHPAWQALPVVALSALSMPGDRETALEAGFNGYLTKPITPEFFLKQVEEFLPASLRVEA